MNEHEQYFESTSLNELQFNTNARSNSTEDNFSVNNIDDTHKSFFNDSIASNLGDNIVKRTPSSRILQIKKNFKATEHEQDLETISTDEIQLNSVINLNKNSPQNCDVSDEQSFTNLSSGSDSDDNMVYGTPTRSLAVL